MNKVDAIHAAVKKISTPKRAESLARYFKTGPGQYGEGDIFAGLTTPQSRGIARHYLDLSLAECEQLLLSPIHEERSIAIGVLVDQYKKGDEETKKKIFEFYLSHTARINNWDLVDISADRIVGEWVVHTGQKSILIRLAKSKMLWEKRIAILSTFAYLRIDNPDVTFEIADLLLYEKEDLLHKAVGWLLREVGKRINRQTLVEYLQSRYKTMPRTTLRYAIEHFPEEERKKYLKGAI